MEKRGIKSKSKRGLSPVIATVLLILLVIVLASFIFLWARGFISEQIEKFGTPVENLCGSTDFRATIGPGNAGADNLRVSNTGNIDIFQFDVLMSRGGESKIVSFKIPVDSGDSADGDIFLKMADGGRPEKVEVIPALVGQVRGKDTGDAKVFTCIGQGKVIDLQNIVAS